MLEVRNELRTYRTRGDDFELSEDAELRRLQDTYQKRNEEILIAKAGVLRKLYEGYVARLSSLQETHTRAGDIDAALAVREEIVRAEGERALLAPEKAGEDLIRPDAEVDERGEELRSKLIGEWEYVYNGRTWRRILFPDGRVQLWLEAVINFPVIYTCTR